MDYGRIISFGFTQAWKYKSLWILGFLLSGPSGALNVLNLIPDSNFGDFGQFGDFEMPQIVERIIANPLFIVLAVLVVLTFAGIFLVLGTMAVGGMIEAARRFKFNEAYSFGGVFSVGVAHFWRLLAIFLMVFILVIALIGVVIVSGIVAFKIHLAVGILALLILIPIFLIAIFVIVVTSSMGQRIVVIHRKPVFDSLAEAFELWTANLGPTILYALIYIGIEIGLGLLALLIILAVAMPFIAIGIVNLWAGLLIGIPVLLLALLVVEGFTSSVMHLMSTEFYFQIAARRAGSVPQPPPGNEGILPPLSPVE